MEITKNRNQTDYAIEKINERIEQKKLILQNEGVLEKVSEKELMIAELSTRTPIKMIPDRRTTSEGGQIREVGLVAMVANISKGIARDIGLKNWSEEDMKYDTYRFLNILKKYYSNLTLSEVKTAFELASVGQLDQFLPKDKHGNADKNHYQSFSVDYITKILNAYEASKSKIWNKIMLSVKEPEKQESEEDLKLYRSSFIEDILKKFDNYVENDVRPDFLAPHLVVKYLIEWGVLNKENEPTTQEFQIALHKIGSSSVVNVYDKTTIRSQWHDGVKHPELVKFAELEMNLRLIGNAFAILKTSKKNLKDLIPQE